MRIFRRQNWKLATAHCHRRMDWELIHQFLIHRSIYLTQIFTSNLTLCVKSISSLIKLPSAEQAGKSLFKYNYHNSQILFKLWTNRKGFQKNTGHVLNRVSMFFQAPTQSLSMTFWTQPVSGGKAGKTKENTTKLKLSRAQFFSMMKILSSSRNSTRCQQRKSKCHQPDCSCSLNSDMQAAVLNLNKWLCSLI